MHVAKNEKNQQMRKYIQIFIHITTTILVLLWSYAAISKLLTYQATRFQLLGHKLIMNHAGLIAWLIPAMELALVVLILWSHTRRVGLYASAALLAVFTAYIIYMFMYYPAKPCSCGGVLTALSWRQHIVFNLAFMVPALLAGFFYNKAPPKL